MAEAATLRDTEATHLAPPARRSTPNGSLLPRSIHWVPGSRRTATCGGTIGPVGPDHSRAV